MGAGRRSGLKLKNTMVAFVLALLLAAVLGYAAHRGSVCTVRAVAETMHARTFAMFWSVAKSVLWIVAVTVPAFFLIPATASSVSGWSLTLVALAGGFAFGLGAGINGACAYSTMARFVDGEAGMLVTIAGFGLGVFVFSDLPPPWYRRSVPGAFSSARSSWLARSTRLSACGAPGLPASLCPRLSWPDAIGSRRPL
jgi:uncharacterized membrane protein YedE/YeeE